MLDAEDIGFIIKAWGMCAWCGACEAPGGMVLEPSLYDEASGRVAGNVVPSCAGCQAERSGAGWKPKKATAKRVLDFLQRSSPVASPPRPRVERGKKMRGAVLMAPPASARTFPLCVSYFEPAPAAVTASRQRALR